MEQKEFIRLILNSLAKINGRTRNVVLQEILSSAPEGISGSDIQAVLAELANEKKITIKKDVDKGFLISAGVAFDKWLSEEKPVEKQNDVNGQGRKKRALTAGEEDVLRKVVELIINVKGKTKLWRLTKSDEEIIVEDIAGIEQEVRDDEPVIAEIIERLGRVVAMLEINPRAKASGNIIMQLKVVLKSLESY